ncbi:TetR family transcriptional regulator [Amycolatopsis carbonis]|uniref:TetR family transcriptional regulator n=1 Tax=Amycolatopsis carbonis TaxID=715471 RepID=A0A9Y2ICY6_9PSEU|nr:TetR family transcriptional regulator [Amycolatopsis sp. 2-15]WIX76701.1 TetR family transcriptional regulator [Amycolatopsis sp. 2-15]
MAQIAERAGLNRATFFRHFADSARSSLVERTSSPSCSPTRSAPHGGSRCAHLSSVRLTRGGREDDSDQRPRALQRRRIADANMTCWSGGC